MPGHVPDAKPDCTRAMVEGWVRGLQVTEAAKGAAALASGKPCLVGRRGYYRDSMGEVGVNDRGIFDDAIVLLAADTFQTFNGNTDPAVFRRGIATLHPGVWRYRQGIHGLSKPKDRQYPALVQAAPVTVSRDADAGQTRVTETGYFGINIHRAGNFETLSEGCQTVYKPQWAVFFGAVVSLMKDHGVESIPYILTEREAA